MKKIKTEIKNHELETIIVAGYEMIEHVKEHPNTLESNIAYLTLENKNKLLCYFSNLGLLKQVKYLVEHGASIHAYNDSPLISSAKEGHLEVVKYLVRQGANIHSLDDYALYLSAENAHLEVVKYLVEHGANIHADDDRTLRYVTKLGHLDVVKYLIEHGADIHA